ncbi:MAG: pyridoxal phosphate-dependent aminotransferase [Alphaproteobacteria bacterium]
MSLPDDSSDVYIKPPGVRASPTMGADALAKKARSLGIDILTYTLGDLFPKPDEEKDIAGWLVQLKAAHKKDPANAIYAMWAKRSYAPPGGTEGLRAAAAYHFTRDTGITATADDVRAGHGGKGTLTAAFRDLEKKEGRTVFLAGPGWPTNFDVFPTGTRIVEVATDGRGLMTVEQLKAKLAKYPNPDIILINAPSNPTGANYTPAEREALLALIASDKHAAKATVVFDDPYGKLVFDEKGYDIATVLRRGPAEKALFEAGRLAVIRTASKEWGLADLRVGWIVTRNTALLTSVANCNSSEMGGVSGHDQDLLMAALHFGDSFIERTVAELREKRAMLIAGVAKLKFAGMEEPKATIYGWIDFSGLKDKFVPVSALRCEKALEVLNDNERAKGGFTIRTPQDMMRYLAYVAGICPVQGTPFYAPEGALGKADWHVRFTFCGDKAELAEGIRRLQQAEALLDGAAAQKRKA